MTTQNGNSDSSNKTQLRRPETGWSMQVKDAEDQVYPLWGEHLVGREDCEILLTTPHASRKHAKLTLTGGLLRVADLGSANGTFVNGEKVATAELENGDVVRFDTMEFNVIGPKQTAVEPVESAVEPAEENRTMLRPMVEPEKPAPPQEAADKAPASDATGVDKGATGDATEGTKGGAWYEKETPNMTAKMDVGDLQEQFADGATQIVRGIKDIEMPSLVGATGEWAGKVFSLTEDAMTIGRVGANIVFDEPSVSTKHAQIVKQKEGWKIVDLMSTSGTYVNGKKTQASFLTSGDALRFGRVELRFVIDSTDVSSRASPEADQLITGSGRPASGKVPAWLYIAIGFVAVLGIGAYVLFLK